MIRAILTFFLGITLILLILGVISSSLKPPPASKSPQKHTEPLHSNTPNTDNMVVRSDQDLSEETNDSVDFDEKASTAGVNQDVDEAAEERVAREIQILLESEASLSNIIGTNITVLGNLGGSAAFVSHQALLRKINSTDEIQPMSIVCSNTLCNVLIYGSDAPTAEAFANTLLNNELPGVNVTGGEYRVFREENYDFAHVVLKVAKPEPNSPQEN